MNRKIFEAKQKTENVVREDTNGCGENNNNIGYAEVDVITK